MKTPREEAVPSLPWFPWKRERLRRSLFEALATLLNAGLTLPRALETVAQMPLPRETLAVARFLRREVLAGSTLDTAIARVTGLLQPAEIVMLRAAPEAGMLATTMTRLVKGIERRRRVASRLLRAMAYPTIVGAVGLVVGLAVLLILVPRFGDLYQSLFPQAELPLTTALLLSLADVMELLMPWLLIGGVGIGLLVGSVPSARRIGSKYVSNILMHLPGVSVITRESFSYQLLSMLTDMVQGGVEPSRALQLLSADKARHSRQRELQRAIRRLDEGESLARVLAGAQVIPPETVAIIAAGEDAGQLAAMLEKAAEVSREKLENRLTTLTALIEPLLVFALAALTALILLVLFLPLLTLLRGLTGF